MEPNASYYPAHPGEILKEDVLPHFRLTVTEAATRLDLTRANLSRVINGKAELSADLAAKCERAFGVDAELLLNMMAAWSLTRARANPSVEKIERVPEPA